MNAEERMFLQERDYINNNFVLKRVGKDFCIFLEDKMYMKMENCNNVSADFIVEVYKSEKELILDDGIDFDREPYVINMEEYVDEWIREGLWDWRKEVKEYKGCLDLLMIIGKKED